MLNEQRPVITVNKSRTSRRRKLTRVLAIISALVIVVVLRGCFLRPSTNYPGSHFNRGQNAAWLGVEWSMEPHSISEVEKLVAALKKRQITTIFVYVSYLKPNGEFNPTYNHAREFVTAFKQAAPDIEVQAWLGVPVKVPAGTPGASGYVELAEPGVQDTIANFSRSVVQELGFDGVHLDPEPIMNDDLALLQLLKEVRSTLGEDKHLSMATPARLPVAGEVPLLGNLIWSKEYYATVASKVDGIAVMTYDSAMPAAFLYRSWTQLQVVSLTQALAGTHAHIYLGVPTSEERTGSHLPWAENMQTGLGGVIAGLNDAESHPDVITGVAVYPYWETSEDEWRTYSELWLGQPTTSN